MKMSYENKEEFENIYQPGELKKSRDDHNRYLNKEGTKLYCFNPSKNFFEAYAVVQPLLRIIGGPALLRITGEQGLTLIRTKVTETEKQELIGLALRKFSVHVLTQGARDPKHILYKLPTDLLGKIATGFFPSAEKKLSTKIRSLLNQKKKQQDTYCGFKPGFLSGQRF